MISNKQNFKTEAFTPTYEFWDFAIYGGGGFLARPRKQNYCWLIDLKFGTTNGIDPFTKRHRLVHNGRFPKFEALYWSLSMISSIESLRNLSYLPNYKVSNQFKSCNGFWIYPPLWTSYLVAMHDDIENRSIDSISKYAKLEVINVSTFWDMTSQVTPNRKRISHRDSRFPPWNGPKLKNSHFLYWKTSFLTENYAPHLCISLVFEQNKKVHMFDFSRHLIYETTAAFPLGSWLC